MELKRKSYGRLKTNRAKLSENFTASPPFRRVFRSGETPLWHTSAISQPPNPILQLRNGLRKWHPAAKIPFGCEMISQPHSYPLPNPPCAAKMTFCYQMIFKLPNGYEMISKLQNGYEMIFKLQNWCENGFWLRNHLWASKWLRNDLQAAKSPPGFEIDLGNGERFAKTLCKAKGSCENAREPRNHASKEESPLIEITHMKSLTPFLTSLNHQSPQLQLRRLCHLRRLPEQRSKS